MQQIQTAAGSLAGLIFAVGSVEMLVKAGKNALKVISHHC